MVRPGQTLLLFILLWHVPVVARAQPDSEVRLYEDDLPSLHESFMNREAILRLLRRYERALEGKDMETLTAIWPRLLLEDKEKARAIRSSFQFTSSLQLDLEVLDLRLGRDDTAVAVCRRHDQLVLEDGERFESESVSTFRLRKRGSSWIIESIEVFVDQEVEEKPT